MAVNVTFEALVLDENGRHTTVQQKIISGNRALGEENINVKAKVDVAYAGGNPSHSNGTPTMEGMAKRRAPPP